MLAHFGKASVATLAIFDCPGSAGGHLDNQTGWPPVGPGHVAQKSRPIFKDDFLRNVIVSICFLVFLSKPLRFRVPNKS